MDAHARATFVHGYLRWCDLLRPSGQGCQGLATHHNPLVPRPADDGREDGARRVVAGKAGLDHPGPVVAYIFFRTRNESVRYAIEAF